jgi:2-polyprenyl-6-methoxyphenol hydroxylase-like FAD-dependent oxidoreductase
MALEDAMYLAKMLRDHGTDYAAAFARFEIDRKPRVERIVADGRRRAGDKASVSPLKSKIRNAILRVVLRLYGERGQDWLFRYRIQWEG